MRYHFVGDLDLTESSSAGAYGRDAHATIDAIQARNRVPIVAGGTGLYLRAALGHLDFPAKVAEDVANDVEALVAADLPGALGELRRLRPATAERIDARNPRRVARALALARSGIEPPRDRLWSGETRHPTLLVGVVRPRPVLHRLIAARVARELADGLLDEVGAALDTPRLSREAAQIIGVREVRALRRGELTPAEVPDRLSARTRRLARAQLTWLRKTPNVVELDLGEAPPGAALPALLDAYRYAHRREVREVAGPGKQLPDRPS